MENKQNVNMQYVEVCRNMQNLCSCIFFSDCAVGLKTCRFPHLPEYFSGIKSKVFHRPDMQKARVACCTFQCSVSSLTGGLWIGQSPFESEHMLHQPQFDEPESRFILEKRTQRTETCCTPLAHLKIVEYLQHANMDWEIIPGILIHGKLLHLRCAKTFYVEMHFLTRLLLSLIISGQLDFSMSIQDKNQSHTNQEQLDLFPLKPSEKQQ